MLPSLTLPISRLGLRLSAPTPLPVAPSLLASLHPCLFFYALSFCFQLFLFGPSSGALRCYPLPSFKSPRRVFSCLLLCRLASLFQLSYCGSWVKAFRSTSPMVFALLRFLSGSSEASLLWPILYVALSCFASSVLLVSAFVCFFLPCFATLWCVA